MNYIFIFIINLFFSFALYSADIKIIDLHNVSDEKVEVNENNISQTIISNEESVLDKNEEKLKKFKTLKEDYDNQLNEILELEEEDLNNNIEVVKSLPDFWQNSNKEDLEFLFNNLKINNSKVLTNLLLDALVDYVNAPKVYSQEEFDYLRVKTLINLGQREKALSLINNINTYDSYKYYYDLLKLNYYFSINDLTEACNFKEVLQDNFNDETKNL